MIVDLQKKLKKTRIFVQLLQIFCVKQGILGKTTCWYFKNVGISSDIILTPYTWNITFFIDVFIRKNCMNTPTWNICLNSSHNIKLPQPRTYIIDNLTSFVIVVSRVRYLLNRHKNEVIKWIDKFNIYFIKNLKRGR